MQNSKTVVLLSGGVDSSYLLALACSEKPHQVVGGALGGSATENLVALFVDYGQPAAQDESAAAWAFCKHFGVDYAELAVAGIPLGDMAEGRAAHVVPARNLWLASLAVAFLPPVSPSTLVEARHQVVIGCAPQDVADYADCRSEFLTLLRYPLDKMGANLVWSEVGRAERKRELDRLGILDLTYSCYVPSPACGECPSCRQ